MLLYLATLQNVPRSLYESAEIDGAGVWGKFKSITLPLITPIIFLRCDHLYDRFFPNFSRSLCHDEKWNRWACKFLAFL